MLVQQGQQGLTLANIGTYFYICKKNPAFYICNGPYLCELKCNTKGAQCINNHSTGIVLSGTNYENTTYTWESGSASTLWDFTGKGRTLPFGAYAQVEFTD